MSNKPETDDFLAKYTDLNLKYADLQSQHTAAKNEIAALKEKLSKLQSEVLPEESEKVLVALSQVPSGDGTTAEQIARHLKLGEQVVQFHLDELASKRFSRASYAVDSDTFWNIDREGRKYLMQRGLLK